MSNFAFVKANNKILPTKTTMEKLINEGPIFLLFIFVASLRINSKHFFPHAVYTINCVFYCSWKKKIHWIIFNTEIIRWVLLTPETLIQLLYYPFHKLYIPSEWIVKIEMNLVFIIHNNSYTFDCHKFDCVYKNIILLILKL